MLAQFSIWPLDNPHMSKDVSEISTILQEAGVKHEVGPMGTVLEGEWDEVMAAIKRCQEELRRKHERVFTSITIDDDATRQQSINGSKEKLKACS